MSAPRTDMHRLQEAIRLHRLGRSRRQISRLMKMGRTTLARYLDAFKKASVLDGDPDALPEAAALRAIIAEYVEIKVAPQQRSSVERWRPQIARLRGSGAGPTAIHDHLRLHDPEYTGSVSAIKRLCKQLQQAEGPKATAVAIPVETAPGEVAQVDFKYAGKRYDPVRGVMRRCWIFVMTLAYSRRDYGEFVFDQSIETWIRAHINAFEYFGGVPAVVVPDNLKAAVIRAAFGASGDTVLNRSYRELARAYGFCIDPTPVRSPEKKGKVERNIEYIGNNFLATLDPNADIVESQRLLMRWLAEVSDQRVHGTTRRRPIELFEEGERAALQPLPSNRWEQVIWKEVTVHRDCHVQVDKALYSVPWKLVGSKIWARCTKREIALSAADEAICRHRRAVPGERRTVEDHLPEGRRDLRHRSRSHWENRARLLGPEVLELVTTVFSADDVLLQLRRVQSIVTLFEDYPRDRARNAAKRALHFGNLEYRSIKRMLHKGLDLEPLADEPTRAWSSGSRHARVPTASSASPQHGHDR